MANKDQQPKLKPQHAARFRRIAAEMNRLLDDVREYIPEANLYLEDSGNWNLLSGDSHDEHDEARQDRVLAFELVPHSGGGAW